MEQREIKFRAWNSKSKYMVSPEYGNWISFDGVLYEEADRKYNTPHTEIEKSKDLILMQFTGLKDKNGKDIYEGDILKFGYPVNGADGEEDFLDLIVVIDFHGAAFWFTGGGYTDCNWHFYNAVNREIIGNIYEHPHLLNNN